MAEYNYPEHYVEDVFSAIELAEQLKESGEYDLFRGQRHVFPLQPSALRPGVDIPTAEAEIDDFANWVHSTPDLKSLHGNERAILAVAQHYGLKTPLLDFSRSPRVAGFFAADGGKDGDTGTIICVNKKRFDTSWSEFNKKYYEREGSLITEIIGIDVKNLWRLQAQEGEFLRCHAESSLFEMFSYFLHIYFPQKSGAVVLPREQIYPTEKSHLEVLLDQYFLIASYPERNRRLAEIFPTSIHTGSDESITREVEEFFKNSEVPPKHNSWTTNLAVRWLQEPEEHYHDHVKLTDARLILPGMNSPDDLETAIEEQLVKIFANNETNNRASIRWSIIDENGHALYANDEGITTDNDEFTYFALTEMVDAIYAGMRYLPFDDSQIVRAITRYVTMLSFGVYEVIDDCEGVEFSGGGIRGRGFAARKRILGALRKDFYEMIEPTKLNKEGKLNFRDTILAARFVKSSYNFDRFLELFVEDLIPSQAVVAVERLVLGVNPARVEVFGES